MKTAISSRVRLEGLKNTLLIALVGLAVGIIIGTLIATVRVVPKYKRLPRVLNGIASFYVGFFRGTPMVVQLLLFYYVLLPLLGVKSSGVQVSMIVFGLNSGARRKNSLPADEREFRSNAGA